MNDILNSANVAMIDGAGAYGSILHYSLTIAFVGSAFLYFIHLWAHGRLDMDEGPKHQMMENESEVSSD
jgi:hypothetical protein